MKMELTCFPIFSARLVHSLEMATNELTDRYFQISGDAYLLNVADSREQGLRLFVSSPETATEAISFLRSEFRKAEVIDSWSPHEIALFIAAITRFGRDWESIKSVLPTKTAMDLSQFYYSVWKGSQMYLTWKKIRKQRGLD